MKVYCKVYEVYRNVYEMYCKLLQEELDETGSAMLINRLAAVLQELNRRKILSDKLYVKLKDDNNIL